jgi:pimeloyl-ACP methyl ester carboxylesterase
MVGLDIKANDLYEQLKYFRSIHAYHYHSIANIEWKYLVGGQNNKDTLLLLPGAPGLGELAFEHILRFESTYLVISLNYPAGVTTMTSLVNGIAAILEHEQIDTVFVLGGSYSGLVAQCLVRRYPHKVSKLILDHTSPPSKEILRIHTTYHLLLTWLPLACTRFLLKCGNHLSTSNKGPELRFWGRYFDDYVIAVLTKEDYLSRIQASLDYHQNYSFERGDLSSWPGDILIIEADNDNYVPPKARAALKNLYPTAQIYTFQQTGHSAWATDSDTFFSVIAHFLEEK